MRKILMFCLLLVNLKIISSNSNYDYSNYNGTITNIRILYSQSITCSISRYSAVFERSILHASLSGLEVFKSGGLGDSLLQESYLYGINAAILFVAGGGTISGGRIYTSGNGSNALVVTNHGNVGILNTIIETTGESNARGIHASYEGIIDAQRITIKTKGYSSPAVSSEIAKTEITCLECILNTVGEASPLFYSKGAIKDTRSTGNATNSKAVVIEGKNYLSVKGSKLKCGANPISTSDACGILIHQIKSDEFNDTEKSIFSSEYSTIEILSDSVYYSSAPMFYITNTNALIILEKSKFIYGSKKFLIADAGEYGTPGKNGAQVLLKLWEQDIEGDIIVGSSSSLTIELLNSTIKGTINGDKKACKLTIILNSNSNITLTGNSYYTSISNNITDGSNLINGSYAWTSYKESLGSCSSNNFDDEINDDDDISDFEIFNNSGEKIFNLKLFIIFFFLTIMILN